MGHVAGVKFFLISQSRLDIRNGSSQRSLHFQDRSMSLRWVTSVVCKSQNNDFWKSSLGLKPLWGWKCLDFSLPFFSPHYAELVGENFFDTLMVWSVDCNVRKTLCIFKKIRDPIFVNPFFGSKCLFFCNFGPWPLNQARWDFRFWGVIFPIWIKMDQVMNILSFCLTNCIPINRNLHFRYTTLFYKNFFIRTFFYKNFFIRIFL